MDTVTESRMAIAMAAAYLNKTIAHIEGGDVTGSIDESVRHAITKLAHLHFVTNEDAHRRVLAMGEDPQYVFNTGSLDVEVASQVQAADQVALAEKLIGDIDKAKPKEVVDIAVMQVNREKIRTLGINPPTSATVTLQSNVPTTTTTATTGAGRWSAKTSDSFSPR